MKNKITRHHTIPKSKWGTSHYNNLLKLKDVKHRAFHVVFENDLPHEQIETLLDLNWNALNYEFTQDITEFLKERTIEDIYNGKCYIENIINKF